MKTAGRVLISVIVALFVGGVAVVLTNQSQGSAAETVAIDSVLACIPRGCVLQQFEEDRVTGDTVSMLIDAERRVGRRELSVDSAVGSTINLFDKEGHTTFNCLRHDLYRAEADFDQLVRLADPIHGFQGVRALKMDSDESGRAGADTLIVRISDPAGRADLCVEMVVDKESGLRVREEWKSDGKIEHIVTRGLVARSPEISALLEPSSLIAMAGTVAEERRAKLDRLPYRVFRIEEPSLVLKSIVPGVDWNNVRLEYVKKGDPDSIAAVVTSWGLGERRTCDYPAHLAMEKSEAIIETSVGGSRMCWAEGGTAIQLQVSDEGLDLKRLADSLR